MKLSIFLLFVLITNVSANTLAQKKMTVVNNGMTFKEIFLEIKRQTGYTVVYNNHRLDRNERLKVDFKDAKVEEVLDKILSGTGLTYELMDEFIILSVVTSVPEKKEVKIVGKVTDEKKYPLPGVTVRLKGVNLGTATDKDGKYVLTIPKLDQTILIFSFIGMETQEIKYSGKDTVDVVLKETNKELDEVVVVNTGYHRVDARKLTSAITSIKAEDIVVSGLNSIDQMLEGHVPGMIFMQNSGQLGATPRLRIRGTSTILGNQEPLWVVDGIVQHDPVNIDPAQLNDLDFVNLLGNAISGLNPDDVEQIDVLKDASATAIYGARAANGVIVITTKKGKAGPPTISYSLAGNFMSRPHYSDRSVNMMNSVERIALSRELMEKGIVYSNISSWVGYEAVMRDYYDKKINYDEMCRMVGRYESVNTDWFDILMQNSFSHKHTLSVSGGSESMKYYASVGYNDSKGNIKGELNRIYNANLNLTAQYKRFSLRFNMSGNVGEKNYTPGDIGVTNYAYNTSRAVPAYNEDGSLWYYSRVEDKDALNNTRYLFNIINDVNHSWQEINSNQVNFVTGLDYRVIDPLSIGLTLSYSTSNTYQETYHGEETYLAKTYYTESDDNEYNILSIMPYGGELKESNQRNNSWMLRGQADFNKYLDADEHHQLMASLGGELSSSRYIGKNQTYLGYLPDRGKQVALVNLSRYQELRDLISDNPEIWGGVRTDNLNRMASGYLSVSYNYKDLYLFNFNARADASNAFGNRSNEKLNPIWSVSARWNVKDDVLKRAEWVNSLSLRGSFGYQGNMLPSESPELIIQQGHLSPTLNEYASKVYKFPNPNLKWEKTSSMNVTMDFALLKNKLRGTVSYYYKKTKDAFLSKSISEINGISSYTVNRGTLENQGVELSLNVIPVNNVSGGNPDGFRWTFDPQIGQVLNKLLDKAVSSKDKSLKDEKAITYEDYLNGSVEITGRPLNTFYSYKYTGLDAKDGRPCFGEIDAENEEKYDGMSKEEVFLTVMEHSGTRVPFIQGGILNTFSYKRFVLSFNLAYSLGSKVRLLQMYPNVYSANGTIAPQPLENVRREFMNRWKRPGDEQYTDVPGIITNSEFIKTLKPWWTEDKVYRFASNIWQMYDNSNIRVVSGDYLKMQSLSLRYNIPSDFCQKIFLKSAYIGFSGTNLFTICSKKLNGQDPATQSGSASSINMSLRPTYSFNLNVSF